MPSTEEQIKNIISKCKDKATKQQIARELKMSPDYTGLVCKELERKGKILFSEGWYSLISGPKEEYSCVSRKTERPSKKVVDPVLFDVPGVPKRLINIVEKTGYKTIESLAEVPIAILMGSTKLKMYEAAQLINSARGHLDKIGK